MSGIPGHPGHAIQPEGCRSTGGLSFTSWCVYRGKGVGGKG